MPNKLLLRSAALMLLAATLAMQTDVAHAGWLQFVVKAVVAALIVVTVASALPAIARISYTNLQALTTMTAFLLVGEQVAVLTMTDSTAQMQQVARKFPHRPHQLQLVAAQPASAAAATSATGLRALGPDASAHDGAVTDPWVDPLESVDSLIITERGSSTESPRSAHLNAWNRDAGGDVTRAVLSLGDSAPRLGSWLLQIRGGPIDGAQARAMITRMLEHGCQTPSTCQYSGIEINHHAQPMRRNGTSTPTSETETTLWDLVGRAQASNTGPVRSQLQREDAPLPRQVIAPGLGHTVPLESPKLSRQSFWSRAMEALLPSDVALVSGEPLLSSSRNLWSDPAPAIQANAR